MSPSRNVLVVDDVATNRALLRAILQRSGHNVTEADNGFECIKLCETNPPDALLLDVMMPDLDGLEVCRRLRKLHSLVELPIIIVTTLAESDHVATALECGANDYVSKPIDRAVLMARLANQFALKDLHALIATQKAELLATLSVQQAMGDVLPEGILVANQAGQIVYSNSNLTKMCGGVGLANVADFTALLSDGRFVEVLDVLVRTFGIDPNGVIDDEFEAEGLPALVLQIVSRPVSLPNGTLLRMWLFRDVTQMRRLERVISQQVRLETVSQFAAGVAHNFNNVFVGILGAANLLDRQLKDDPKFSRLVELIKKSVEGGASFTQKLGVLVRRDAQRDAKVTIDLKELLRTVCQNYQGTHAPKLDCDLDISVQLSISQQDLKVVINNVISNAVDAVAAGGDVKVSARREDADERVIISVADTGVGMDSVTRDRIFEPFFSTKNMDTTNNVSYAGNGLGMWNVHGLVKMAGGDVRVQSAPGQGTSVEIVLPQV